jgi:hypothetical protein
MISGFGFATHYAYRKKELTGYVPIGTTERRNMKTIVFLKRLGPNPHAHGAQTAALKGCPDIFELETGDFAIIGSDITDYAARQLPSDASCGPDERIVRIPRKTLVLAKPDIPNAI